MKHMKDPNKKGERKEKVSAFAPPHFRKKVVAKTVEKALNLALLGRKSCRYGGGGHGERGNRGLCSATRKAQAIDYI